MSRQLLKSIIYVQQLSTLWLTFALPCCTLYIFFFKLPPYTLAGFDLTAHSSSLLGDETTYQ
jgi:hypothetical protein